MTERDHWELVGKELGALEARPDPRPPELGAVLDATCVLVRRYVLLSAVQADANALWTLHSHAIEAAAATPYLWITSAVKESGKTRLLEVLDLLVARPWLTGRVTAAVLARKVDAEKPTLLLDESDAAFNGEKEYAETLRGILNSGYRRSGKSSVCVRKGADIGYVDLSTFCAKAIAGIGELPDTVASRSIPIRLKRKAPEERVERFYERKAGEEAEPLYQALVSLGAQYVVALAEARPELPEELPDRAADVWEPLLAIADLAGGDWPERARRAAIALSGRGSDGGALEISVQLLADCRPAFGERDRLPTKDLIDALAEDEEAPWATWHKGSRISPRALARTLEPFGIRSRTIRLDGGETPKGYLRESFEDAWKRYLSSPAPPHTPDLSATTPRPVSVKGSEAISIRHTTSFVADCEEAANPHGSTVVADVADKTLEYGGREELEAVAEVEEPDQEALLEEVAELVVEGVPVRLDAEEPGLGTASLSAGDEVDGIDCGRASWAELQALLPDEPEEPPTNPRLCRCSNRIPERNEDGEPVCFTCGKRLELPRPPEEVEAEQAAKNEAARLAGEQEDRQLGGALFPLLIADAVRDGHITESEAEVRLALQRRVAD